MKIPSLFSWSALAACALALISPTPASAKLEPENLRVEHLVAPLGIDAKQPLLSWTTHTLKTEIPKDEKGKPVETLPPGWIATPRNQRQVAYQVLTASSRELLAADKGDVWDSGRVESTEQSVLLPVGKIASNAAYHWKVRVWDQDGKPSDWSRPARWSAGLLAPEDWKNAEWLGIQDRGRNRNDPWYRKTFTLETVPQHAFVHLASFGFHELYVNGKPADDSILNPAVTDLTRRVLYRSYDIASLLKPGKNVIAVWLGHGWTDWEDWQDKYGSSKERPEGSPGVRGSQWGYRHRTITHGPAFRAILATGDSAAPVVVSDTTWRTTKSPLSVSQRWGLFNFGGENYDARADDSEWNTVAFDDAKWDAAAKVKVEPDIELSAHALPPNRVQREIRGVSIEKTGDKKWRLDMGEDIVGRFRIPLSGKAGTVVEIAYTDRFKDEAPQGQVDRITLTGKNDVFESRFNYRAARWITFRNLETPPEPSAVVGKLIRTDYPSASEFSCADGNLNKINAVVRHTFECVTLGGQVVDCPHRERCGYGAEGQANMECGLFQFDQAAFNRKWLVDWSDSADPANGRIPYTAPTKWGGGGPAWQMIVVTLPWETYLHSGDKRVLAEHYATMVNYLEWIQRRVRDNVLSIYDNGAYNYLGDWMAYNVPEPERSRQFFSNCFLIHTLQTAAKTAAVLGRTDDVKLYSERAEAMKAAVHKRFYNADGGFYFQKEQTYLAFPLLIGLPPADIRPAIEKALAENITVTRKGHISTGVLGTYIMLKYLTASGRNELVHLMATQKKTPGWLYFFDQGMTAIPEVWDGFLQRCSSTHSSYNSIGAWFINGLAGIQPDPAVPGFKHFFVRPGATNKVGWVNASHNSINGKIAVAWRNANADDDARFTLEITVPASTTATVEIPMGADGKVSENGSPVSDSVGKPDTGILSVSTAKPGVATVTIGSGTYCFEVK